MENLVDLLKNLEKAVKKKPSDKKFSVCRKRSYPLTNCIIEEFKKLHLPIFPAQIKRITCQSKKSAHSILNPNYQFQGTSERPSIIGKRH